MEDDTVLKATVAQVIKEFNKNNAIFQGEINGIKVSIITHSWADESCRQGFAEISCKGMPGVPSDVDSLLIEFFSTRVEIHGLVMGTHETVGYVDGYHVSIDTCDSLQPVYVVTLFTDLVWEPTNHPLHTSSGIGSWRSHHGS